MRVHVFHSHALRPPSPLVRRVLVVRRSRRMCAGALVAQCPRVHISYSIPPHMTLLRSFRAHQMSLFVYERVVFARTFRFTNKAHRHHRNVARPARIRNVVAHVGSLVCARAQKRTHISRGVYGSAAVPTTASLFIISVLYCACVCVLFRAGQAANMWFGLI